MRRHVLACLSLALGTLPLALPASAWLSRKADPAPAEAVAEREQPAESRQIRESQARYDEVLRRIEGTLREARERLTALSAEQTALEEEIATTEANIERLREVNVERYFQLEEQQKKLDGIEQAALSKNERVSQLLDAVQAEKQLRELEQAQAGLAAELVAVKARLAERERAFAEVEAEGGRRAHELAESREALAERERENAAVSQQVEQLQEALARSEKEKETLLESLDRALREFEEYVRATDGRVGK